MNDDEIRKKVKELYLSNIKQGYNKKLDIEYSYISPSPGHYPNQFFWDTCFEVFVLCELKEFDLAKKNIISLFAMQEKDGFIGHILFWEGGKPRNILDLYQSKPSPFILEPHMSALIQPPLVAQAINKIYQATNDKDFLKLFLPKLKKYFFWLERNRDFEGEGLLSIITSFESGMDWKPSFDPVWGFPHGKANKKLYQLGIWVDTRNFLNRYDLEKIYKEDYFIVKEVGFNTFYAEDLSYISELCKAAGDNDAKYFANKSKKVTEKMCELMYDEKEQAFFDLYSRNMTKSKILAPTIFFPIVLPNIPISLAQKVFERHLLNKEEFDIKYPIPSVAKNDISFEVEQSQFLWRGPTWIVYNWMLYKCLMTKGFKKQGEVIFGTMKKLIQKSGFREYYNPFTGEGHGAKKFTWSGLVVDMMEMKKQLNNYN